MPCPEHPMRGAVRKARHLLRRRQEVQCFPAPPRSQAFPRRWALQAPCLASTLAQTLAQSISAIAYLLRRLISHGWNGWLPDDPGGGDSPRVRHTLRAMVDAIMHLAPAHRVPASAVQPHLDHLACQIGHAVSLGWQDTRVIGPSSVVQEPPLLNAGAR